MKRTTEEKIKKRKTIHGLIISLGIVSVLWIIFHSSPYPYKGLAIMPLMLISIAVIIIGLIIGSLIKK